MRCSPSFSNETQKWGGSRWEWRRGGIGRSRGRGNYNQAILCENKISFNTWEKLTLEKMQARAVDFNPTV